MYSYKIVSIYLLVWYILYCNCVIDIRIPNSNHISAFYATNQCLNVNKIYNYCVCESGNTSHIFLNIKWIDIKLIGNNVLLEFQSILMSL